MTLQKPQDNQLLDQLKDIPKDDLVKAASLAIENQNGSTVEPVYSRRKILCYSITESELKTFGFSHGLSTVLFSAGSIFFGFGLDIFKDQLLSDTIPSTVSQVAYYAQYFSFIISFICFAAGGFTIYWRRGYWADIMSEQPK